MKLNLGCGFDKRTDFIHVDSFPECSPDRLVDLEQLPWPFETVSVDTILMKHVLEHLGREPAVFLGIIKELYRICKPGATIVIHVPHYLHENYASDPTHVRAITPLTFKLLSKRLNREWITRKVGNSMLGLALDVDFDIVSCSQVYDEPWRSRLKAGQVKLEEVRAAARTYANVVREYQIVLRVVKDAG